MIHFMRIVFVSISAFLVACSSAQKKADIARPVVAAPAAVAAKPEIAAQPAKAAKPVQQLSCEQGADKRMIVIEPKEKGCEVHYSKFGNSEKVAYAVHTPHFCEEVKDKIRAHLEAGQFTCK